MGKTKQRSKAYPAIDLETAEATLAQVKSQIGEGPHDRPAIAAALGSKSTSGGAAARKVAALAHYGLMDRADSAYTISTLGKRLINPISEKEASEARLEAFYTVSLFSDLMRKYSESGSIPKLLGNILVREHGISDAAKENATEIFLASAKYVGVINPDLNIVDDVAASAINEVPSSNPADDFAEQVTVRPDDPQISRAGKQVFRMSLTGGKQMYWELPESLNQKDIAIIQKQIELLELQMGE